MTQVFDAYSKEQVDTLLAAGGGSSLSTVSALKALSGTQLGGVAQVLGYYAANDGGGGLFRWNSSSTATDNGGTVITPNSAPASGRWERVVTNGVLNVRWFGAKGDGSTDDTAAFAAACTAANASSTNKVVYVPSGTYILAPYVYSGAPNGITVYSGCSLVGDGYSSVLRHKASSYTTAGNGTGYNCITFQSNTRIASLRIDGNRAAVNRTGLTSIQVLGFYGVPETASNCVFEDLWIHDILGIVQESFGILLPYLGSQFVVRNVQAYNVEGTGIATNGDYLGTPISDILIDRCKCYSNTWQGVSIYGAQNVKLYDSQFYSNTLHGINMEWSTNVDIHDCKSYSNGNAGIGCWGKNSYRAFNCTLINNNSATSGNGEVRVGSTVWFGTSRRENAGTIELNNLRITPTTNGTHLYYTEDATVTNGSSVPDAIIINQPDAKDWTIKTSLGASSYPASLRLTDQSDLKGVLSDRFSAWTSSGATAAAYTGSDATGSDATTITATAQFFNIFSGMILKPYRQYLMTCRVKVNDTKRWTIAADYVASGSGVATDTLWIPNTTQDVGTWFTTALVLSRSPNERRIQIMLNDVPTGSSTITVDYLNVIELASSSSLHMFDSQGPATIVWRTGVPTTGTWSVPSIVYNSAPSAAAPAGWVVTTAGTAGTYAEGRTAATTNASPNVTLSGTTTVLKPGDYLTINAQSKRVVSISGTAMVMDSNYSSTGSGFAITYTAPVFTPFAPVAGGNATDSAASGAVTLTTSSPRLQRFTGTFTANRTITLPGSGLYVGDTFEVVRRQSGTSIAAFSLAVGSVATIPASWNAFVKATWDGSAWVLGGGGFLNQTSGTSASNAL